MNWDQIQDKWKEAKGDVLSTWGELTNDEVDQIDGDREKLEGMIQSKYGKTKAEAHEAVNKWLEA